MNKKQGCNCKTWSTKQDEFKAGIEPGSQKKTEIRESMRKRKCIKGRRQSNHKGDRNMPIRFNWSNGYNKPLV